MLQPRQEVTGLSDEIEFAEEIRKFEDAPQ